MRWSEMIAGIRDRLQETSESFFGTDRLMELARRAQAEIAVETCCCEGTDTLTTAADVREYRLPGDCAYLTAVRCGGRVLGRMDHGTVSAWGDGCGSPTVFYVRGDVVGLHPRPAGAESLELWYVRRPPMGAFTITHDGGAGATAATCGVDGAALTLTVTGGTNAGSYVLPLSDVDGDATALEIVSGINALGKGFTATLSDTCREGESATRLEPAAGSCFQRSLLMDLKIEAPAEWQWLIEVGVMYRALWKDMEFGAGEYYRREYESGMERMRRQISRRRTMSGMSRVRDRYAGRGVGAGLRLIVT